METSLGKLQRQVDKLSKENTKLRDANTVLKEQCNQYKRTIDEFNAKIEKEIQKALSKFEASEIERLTKENKQLKERIFKLEQRLNISSETSALPPSQDPLWTKNTTIYDSRSQKTDKKAKGGQFGHAKNELDELKEEEITDTVEHTIDKCTKCGSDDLTLIGETHRDEIDIHISNKGIRHYFYIYKCNNCGEIIKTEIPKNLTAKNQYGANTQALALALIDFGDVSFRRTRKIINGITNGKINPSEGYLGKLSKRASKALSNFIFDCEEEIVKSSIVQHDDGVIKIGKTDEDLNSELEALIEKKEKEHELSDEEKEKLEKDIKKNFNGVIRAYTNREIMLYKAHTSKDADTYQEDNILNRLSETTTVVHDHMKYNYNEKFNFKNAECNIHAIRKCRGVKANTNHKWTDKMVPLLESHLEKKKELIKEYKEKNETINCLPDDILNNLYKEYDQIVEDGIKEANTFVHKTVYKDEINLLMFFKEYKEEILCWATDFAVDFTNNLCELMIRLIKSKMKISYCFKNIETAKYYADIISYTETCNHYGIDRYAALVRLFQENPYSLAELKEIKKNQEEALELQS